MKKVICLALLLLLVSLAFAQKQKVAPAGKSPLQSMVETEFAFAKMSLDQGTRPAFMACLPSRNARTSLVEKATSRRNMEVVKPLDRTVPLA